MGKRARTKGRSAGGERRRRKGQGPEVSSAALPAIEALHDLPTFSDFCIDAAQLEAFEKARVATEAPDEMQIGCVVRLDRGFPLVVTADDCFRAEHAVGFAKQNKVLFA